ncbi:TetR/AcrR family transcriptional regulator [Desertivirga arenae]|uniref:TetR/AcrR family transcriptional regulator n=1 Tax=Desertivirga arenae TaxID=2810309 RepID=UPI001A96E9D1|nr:TetR/AcrR family transcriptional regulator [Pedobacter sp. SYSU D00823]
MVNQEIAKKTILEAARTLIKKFGWKKLTVAMLLAEANVSDSAFKTCFDDLDELKMAYIQSQDFWFKQLGKLSKPEFNINSSKEVKEFVRSLMVERVNFIFESEEWRDILQEQLRTNDPLFSIVDETREKALSMLLNIVNPFFPNSDCGIGVAMAILFGSIDYFSLPGAPHSILGFDPDSQTPEHRQQLIKTIDLVIEGAFSQSPELVN